MRLREQSWLSVLPFKPVVRKGLSEQVTGVKCLMEVRE